MADCYEGGGGGGVTNQMAVGRKIVKDFFFSRNETYDCGPHFCCCTTLHEKQEGWVSESSKCVLGTTKSRSCWCCFSCLDLLLVYPPPMYVIWISPTRSDPPSITIFPRDSSIVTLHLKRQCDLSIHQSVVDFQKQKNISGVFTKENEPKRLKNLKKLPLNHRTSRFGWCNGQSKWRQSKEEKKRTVSE